VEAEQFVRNATYENKRRFQTKPKKPFNTD